MNKIWQLFDEDYVLKLFRKKVLPKYPVFKSVEKVKVIPHKRQVWKDNYHVVLEYKTYFRDRDDNVKSLSLFCTAHQREPRKNVYSALKYLWNHGFGGSNLTIPRPLFYSDQFKATFYRGVQGYNLYYYIKHNDRDRIRETIPKAAHWFAKLHLLPTDGSGVYNFNKQNSRIKTAIPGKEGVLESIGNRYPEYKDLYQKAYDIFIQKEEEFLKSVEKRYLVHGDAHPENIIKMSRTELGVIDFTDLCLSDFARDLGGFLQQFHYMAWRKLSAPDREFIEEMKKLFLDSYFSASGFSHTQDLQERIDNYYYWTMLRSATYMLIKSKPQPDQGRELVEKVRKDLGL